MALNINTIKQASPKANQVATEQYVDTSIAGIDVSSDINANNDTFAQSQGFANYNDMVNKYTSLGKTIINGGYINTGLVNANSISVGSLSADRLSPTNGNSTVWNGGGLISSNFNGNAVGSIGSPSQGFRLSSNAVGSSTDPNIYGAYIKGSTLEGSYLSISDAKLKAATNPNNFGKLAIMNKKFLALGYLTRTLTETLYGNNYSSGYLPNRCCGSTADVTIVARQTNVAPLTSQYVKLYYSYDNINWVLLGSDVSSYASRAITIVPVVFSFNAANNDVLFIKAEYYTPNISVSGNSSMCELDINLFNL